jgi:phosphoesterase RecJ-like protein
VLSSITDVDIAIIFTEQVRDRIKVSWRARPGLDVSRIALSFGGGGHPAAAGAEIHGALPDVRERVLKATQMIEK